MIHDRNQNTMDENKRLRAETPCIPNYDQKQQELYYMGVFAHLKEACDKSLEASKNRCGREKQDLQRMHEQEKQHLYAEMQRLRHHTIHHMNHQRHPQIVRPVAHT